MPMAIETGGLTYWFHESVSCLHDCMAMILQWRGQEPIAVLGAHWCFFHDPANVSTEEFYYPSRTGDLGRDLAPYHELGARWRLAPDSDALLGDICASLDDGRPALLVEDNFFMPNRPAFQDVHAAHLVLVTGYDSVAETLQIMEPTPPLYHGPISRAQLAQAVGSDNQARAQSRDFFFAGSKIAFRWIEVDAFVPVPAMDGDGLRAILERNLDELGATGMSGQLVGIAGLETYLRDLVAGARRSAAVAPSLLGEIYTVGWAHLAQTALHAEFLRQSGVALACPALLEAARRVDSLAGQWTAFRLFGAHGAHGEIPVAAAVAEIDNRIGHFIADHHRAVGAIEQAVAQIGSTGPVPWPAQRGSLR
tara:strand:+ start:359 stop:1453 length:1095 start_codon:yes stop_codon:yes gene_type:complete